MVSDTSFISPIPVRSSPSCERFDSPPASLRAFRQRRYTNDTVADEQRIRHPSSSRGQGVEPQSIIAPPPPPPPLLLRRAPSCVGGWSARTVMASIRCTVGEKSLMRSAWPNPFGACCCQFMMSGGTSTVSSTAGPEMSKDGDGRTAGEGTDGAELWNNGGVGANAFLQAAQSSAKADNRVNASTSIWQQSTRLALTPIRLWTPPSIASSVALLPVADPPAAGVYGVNEMRSAASPVRPVPPLLPSLPALSSAVLSSAADPCALKCKSRAPVLPPMLFAMFSTVFVPASAVTSLTDASPIRTATEVTIVTVVAGGATGGVGTSPPPPP